MSFRRWALASSSVIPGTSMYSRTMAKSSGGSFPWALAGALSTPFSRSSWTRSAGSLDKEVAWASADCPRADSSHQFCCCGGTLAVDRMRLCGSMSQRAMKRRWPGFVGSTRRNGETRCWLDSGEKEEEVLACVGQIAQVWTYKTLGKARRRPSVV